MPSNIDQIGFWLNCLIPPLTIAALILWTNFLAPKDKHELNKPKFFYTGLLFTVFIFSLSVIYEVHHEKRSNQEREDQNATIMELKEKITENAKVTSKSVETIIKMLLNIPYTKAQEEIVASIVNPLAKDKNVLTAAKNNQNIKNLVANIEEENWIRSEPLTEPQSLTKWKALKATNKPMNKDHTKISEPLKAPKSLNEWKASKPASNSKND